MHLTRNWLESWLALARLETGCPPISDLDRLEPAVSIGQMSAILVTGADTVRSVRAQVALRAVEDSRTHGTHPQGVQVEKRVDRVSPGQDRRIDGVLVHHTQRQVAKKIL